MWGTPRVGFYVCHLVSLRCTFVVPISASAVLQSHENFPHGIYLLLYLTTRLRLSLMVIHPELWLHSVNETQAVFTVKGTGPFAICGFYIRAMTVARFLQKRTGFNTRTLLCLRTGITFYSHTIPCDRRQCSVRRSARLPWVGVHSFQFNVLQSIVLQENGGNVFPPLVDAVQLPDTLFIARRRN
jgi:hypothetical protein